MPNGFRKRTEGGRKARRGGSSKKKAKRARKAKCGGERCSVRPKKRVERKKKRGRSKPAAPRVVVDEDPGRVLDRVRLYDTDSDTDTDDCDDRDVVLDARARREARRERVRHSRRSVALQVARRYVEMLRCLSTKWGALLHYPFRIGADWTESDWKATIRPHRGGDVVTIRFGGGGGAPGATAVLEVHDLIHAPVMATLAGDTNQTRVRMATFRSADPEFVCLHASFGARSLRTVPALSRASDKLRGDPDFVARLLRHVRRHRRVEADAKWRVWRELRCARPCLRDDLPFALGLIRHHGVDAWSVRMGASQRVRRYLERHIPMRALALCAQRVRHRWWRDVLRAEHAATCDGEDDEDDMSHHDLFLLLRCQRNAANEPAASRVWTVARDIAAFL